MNGVCKWSLKPTGYWHYKVHHPSQCSSKEIWPKILLDPLSKAKLVNFVQQFCNRLAIYDDLDEKIYPFAWPCSDVTGIHSPSCVKHDHDGDNIRKNIVFNYLTHIKIEMWISHMKCKNSIASWQRKLEGQFKVLTVVFKRQFPSWLQFFLVCLRILGGLSESF